MNASLLSEIFCTNESVTLKPFTFKEDNQRHDDAF